MGFLGVKGSVLTFNQYKDKIENYKRHGLKQFASIYRAHKDKTIPLYQLKWGEEMEYMLHVQPTLEDGTTGRYKLSNRGPELIQTFNKSATAAESGVVLMPEFGGWMIEAVPTEPYKSTIEAEQLLSCFKKLQIRRKVLQEFLKPYKICITSMANAPGLGTKNYIHIDDEALQREWHQN